MITQRMRRVLEDELEYLTEEVDIMEPQIAAVVIERGLARPSAGMPKSWRRKQPSVPAVISEKAAKNLKKTFQAIIQRIVPIFSSVYGGMNFILRKVKSNGPRFGRKVFTIAAPIAIAYVAVPKVLGIVIGASATIVKVVTSIRLPSFNWKLNDGKIDEYENDIYSTPPKKSKSLKPISSPSTTTDANNVDMNALQKVLRKTFFDRLFGQ